MDLETVAGELYRLRPEEFTAARDERVRLARSGGDGDLAREIQRLRKPTTSAWVVNLLVHMRTAEIDQLLGLGDSLREAQTGLKGEELRGLSRQRTQVVASLARQGRRLADEVGHRVSESVEREVEATLEAALADLGAAAAVRSGRLAKSLSYSGFGGVDVSGAVVAPPGGPAARQPARDAGRGDAREAAPKADRSMDRSKIDRAQQALDEAEDDARRAEHAADEVDGEAAEARARREAADEHVASLSAELDQAHRAATDAARDLRQVSQRAERARRAAASARRRVEQARTRLDRLRE